MSRLPEFIDEVVHARDLVVTSAHEHAWRVEPREAALDWFCDLDDGTPTSNENDPPSSVRWVCPALRLRRTATGSGVRTLDVRRAGPSSDLGRLMAPLRQLLARGADREGDRREDRFVYTDPHGVLDGPLRQRVEHWPAAPHGEGDVWTAEPVSVRVTGEGLVVASTSVWGSAPALNHQIALGVDIADRLARVGPR